MPFALEPVTDRPRPPTRMRLAHLHDPRLDRRGHLVRTRTRHRRPVHQPGQPLRRVPLQPAVHASGGSPRTEPRPPRPAPRRSAPRERPDSAAPRHRAPPTRRHPPIENLDREAQPVSQPRVTQLPEPPSPRNRSQLSPKYRDRAGRCRTTTGAATSSIYRDRTPIARCGRRHAVESSDIARGPLLSNRKGPLTWCFVGGGGRI